MRPIVAVTFALTATFALVGCSSEVESTSSPSERSTSAAASAPSLCDAFCEKVAACDTTEDVETCKAACESELGPVVAKHRGDVVASASACFTASSCKEVLGGEQLVECFAEAEVVTTPSESARAFCDALEDALEKCDSTGKLDRAQCLSSVKTYSDATLDKAMSCTTKSCDKISACVEATF